MMSNSLRGTKSGGIACPAHLVGAQARRDLLEHAVDEAVALGAAEALAELDRLVQHDLEGRLGMRGELERADVENRALHRREPREIAIEVRHDQGLQLAHAVAYPGDQRLDETSIALVEALQAARFFHRVAAGELPGIERLQREFARLSPSGLHGTVASAWPSPRRRAPPRRPSRAAPRPAPRPRSSGCR